MVNWFKNINKLSWNAGTATMDDPDKKMERANPYHKDPRNLVTPNPWFGGDIKGDIAKDPANRKEDLPDFKKEVPSGRTILDDEIGQGDGANDERFVPDEDKMPINNRKKPLGPHNMHQRLDRDIYDFVSKRTRRKSVNKL